MSVVLSLRIKWSKKVRQLVVESFVLIFDIFLVFYLSKDTSMKQWLVGCGLLLVILPLAGWWLRSSWSLYLSLC